MTANRFHLLRSPVFIGALLLLLCNDFYLKATFNNGLTGKLSDFAGLFVFAVFWTVLFPRLRTIVFLFTALFFTFWKLPVSNGFVESWNSLMPLHLTRVCDITDLFALLILIPAWRFCAREKTTTFRLLHPVIPFLITTFAFMATSQSDPEFLLKIDKHYDLYNSNPEMKNGIRLRYNEKPIVAPAILEAGWNDDFIILKRGQYADSLFTRPLVKEFLLIEKTTFGKDDVHLYYTEEEFQKARRVLNVPDNLNFNWKAY